MIEKESIFKAWTIDLHERFPHWPYKKPKPGHEGFRLLDGPAPDFRPGKNVVGKYGRVNPETVGQATGILDKRARDIFEGDILKIHHKTPLPVGLAVVKYDKKRSAFRAFPVDRPWYACQIAYPDEIVGNIYDDPDLLKQGEDTQK